MTQAEPIRDTLRSSGCVQGRLSQLLPAIYLHQYEDPNWTLENNRGLHTPGMFALCPPAFARTPHWHVRTGLLLPLHLCRDRAPREACKRPPPKWKRQAPPCASDEKTCKPCCTRAFRAICKCRIGKAWMAFANYSAAKG